MTQCFQAKKTYAGSLGIYVFVRMEFRTPW